MSLQAFFMYFGAKHRLARRYPPPLHDTIIEPFAGSAGYATRYHRRKVTLCEASPDVAALWRYLIKVSAREILGLPLLADGQAVSELAIPPEARTLIGYWLGSGDVRPRNMRSAWRAGGSGDDTWGPTIRARLAAQVERIRHWKVIEGSYELAPDIAATWHIDPPYENQGGGYYGFDRLDFGKLAGWCRKRRGQVMVCEAAPAAWLPFRSFATLQSVGDGGRKMTSELIWTND